MHMGGIGVWFNAYFLCFEGRVAYTGYKCYLYPGIGVFGFLSLLFRFLISHAWLFSGLRSAPPSFVIGAPNCTSLTPTRMSVSIPIHLSLFYIHSTYFRVWESPV